MLVTLALGGMMTIVAIVVHLAGILLLLHLLRRNAHQATAAKNGRDLARQLALIVAVTLGIFIVHGVEIWLYAFAYVLSGALPDLPTAVYFSAVSYSTLGFGDIVLGPEWRIFGAFEGVTGLILIGLLVARVSALGDEPPADARTRLGSLRKTRAAQTKTAVAFREKWCRKQDSNL